MKTVRALVPCLLLCVAALALGQNAPVQQALPGRNPAIDMEGYLKVARQAAIYRETRRLTEEDFLRVSREPGTVVLDARSREKFDELHVKGALNLSFPDIAVESLKKTLPDKATLILIYCNNNFSGAEGPFPSKLPTASLNLSTFIALYNYGYRNVWELGPVIDVKKTKLPLEPTAKAR
ncbi:MAG TPA: rhodanese-like domain-containing protein [Thermoanaerobaculia bacterium]|nr:rhodanese-like domain-containing protein [Thermoanaerobaculia bacterium]